MDLMSPLGRQTRCSWAQRAGQTARSMHKTSMHSGEIVWNADDILFMRCYGRGDVDTGPAEPVGPAGQAQLGHTCQAGQVALLQGSVAQEHTLASNLGSIRHQYYWSCR